MIILDQTELIKKKEIANFDFPQEEVLKEIFRIEDRDKKISDAIELSKIQKNKVNIFFEDSVSIKKVKSEIIDVNNEFLVLKKNALIPIKRVHSIKHY